MNQAESFDLRADSLGTISLREYARLKSISFAAVQRAVKVGRLKSSIVRDHRGAPKISDIALADREWALFTKHDRVPLAARRQQPELLGMPSRETSRARRDAAEADLAEMRLAAMRGELINAKSVQDGLSGLFTVVRTHLLRVSSKLKTTRPNLSVEDIVAADRLIKQALEDLSSPSFPLTARDTEAKETGDEGEQTT